MGRIFASVLGFFANISAGSPGVACWSFLWDEPECPQSLVD